MGLLSERSPGLPHNAGEAVPLHLSRGSPLRANLASNGKQKAMASKKQGGKAPKLKRKDYEKKLKELQVELCHLQSWVKSTGARIMIVFEGRDAAGKGGTIRL
jgi:polyphosphate kinase 2 (PPK2 family)